jgi:hypothetical protein
MVFFALLPCLLWARRGTAQLPVFEVLMLTTVNTYALPLLNGHAELRIYPPEIVTQCAYVVILFQVMAICTYVAVRGEPKNTPFFTEEILGPNLPKYIGYGLVLSTIYTFVGTYYEDLIPYQISSVARAIFYGIGMVTAFAQARRWGQNLLKIGERTTLAVLLAAQIVMQFSTLFLVGGISIMVLALIGYVSGSRRLPITLTVGLVALVALMHNGKGAMREKYWAENDQRDTVQISQLPAFFAEWIVDGLLVNENDGQNQMAKKLIDRTSLYQMLCLVVYSSPDRLPFLEGKTYAQIPGQFVPRPLWPEKPLAHISNSTLAIYYGLQNEEDTLKTTIGFGIVPEAYANFGFLGVGVLGIVIGACYKKIQIATTYSPLLSYAGLFLIMLLAWSFQAEYAMSIWLSSLFQACVGIIGLPFLLRKFLS